MPKPTCDHIEDVDPRYAWLQQSWGRALRYRAIVAWLVSSFGLSGLTYFFSHPYIALAVLALTAPLAGTLYLHRRVRINQITQQSKFHDFSHYLRDKVGVACSENPSDEPSDLMVISTEVATKIAEYFRESLRDPSIVCGIRICREIPAENEHSEPLCAYVTIGRSSGYSTGRDSKSEPIPVTKGLPKLLTDQGHVGCFIINDIKAAIDAEEYYGTKNARKGKFKSCMVAPANFSAGSTKKHMVAVVSVSSVRHGKFTATDTLALRTFADQLGMVYPLLIRAGNARQSGTTLSTINAPHLLDLSGSQIATQASSPRIEGPKA